MAGPFDLTGQNIENTYQRILQTPDGVNIYDGTGSAFTVTSVATAGGSNQNIQFNSSSLLSGSNNLKFDYTNNNIILTGSILMSGSSAITGVDYIDFDTTASIATSVGRLHWNDEDGTLELGLKGGVVSSEIGQGLVTRVVNKTSPLVDLLAANYQVVVIGGAQGQRLSVRLAQGNNDANSAGTLGVVAENIARNESGFVITVGLLKNRNTTGALQGETWNDGDILYLSPTVAGQITNIKPQSPNHTVIVGYVEYAHPVNGKIYVKIDNGYELDELHNVRITTASLTAGQLLVRSGSNNGGVWINSNQLTGSYGLTGSLTATSFTGSLFGTATTASYYKETDPIFTAKSASLATTGSNNFNGNQSITGSVTITGSLLVNNGTYDIISSTNEAIFNSNGSASIGWGNRILYASDGATPSLNWSSNLVTTSPTFFTTTISATSQEDFSSTSNYAGTAIRGAIDSGVVLYDLVCLRDDGIWYQNAQETERSKYKLGIYLDNNLVLIEGHIVIDDTGALGPDVQAPQLGVSIFIRENAGAYMSTVPPNVGYVRILGHIYYQNQNTDTNLYIMRFNPSNDFYLLG